MNEWLWEIMKVDDCWLSEGEADSLGLICINLAFTFFLVSATLVQHADTITSLFLSIVSVVGHLSAGASLN